jgi:hypothetical protein
MSYGPSSVGMTRKSGEPLHTLPLRDRERFSGYRPM